MDLLAPPDDRIDLILAGKGGKVSGELVEQGGFRGPLLEGLLFLGLRLRIGIAVQHRDHLPDRLGVDAVPLEEAFHARALLPHEGD